MWLQIALFTASALSAALSVWFALRASRASDAAAHSEARLLTQRGRIVGIEEAQERLLAMHRKLAGRIYADEYHGNLPARPLGPDLPPRASVTGDACENYVLAQREGPHSSAARCECGYCADMRAQRDAFRSAAVPKTVIGAKVNGVTDG